ncbi:hypothetical protein BKA81DRAFT_24095 [Phyllosticta paracitricarpa]
MKDTFDQVALNHPLAWKVTESVVAEWTDADSDRRSQLGTIDTKNCRTGPNLVLAVGCRDNTLLIIIHIAVKLRPSTGSKPKPMFLVLPVESLLHPPSCEVLGSNKVSENTLTALGKWDGESGTKSNPKRIIKSHFQLKDSGYVIMPQATIQRQVQGSPRSLLEDFRSLSNSLSLDIYMRFNTFAEVGLRQASQIISNGQAATPTIHVHRMFNQIGAINIWDQYLLPPQYKEKSPVDEPRHRPQVLVPRSVQASPSHKICPANTDEGPFAIKETPPPLPQKSPSSLQPRQCTATSPTSRPPSLLPPQPPKSPQPRKRRAMSPPPADDDDLESFCSLMFLWLPWAWTILPDAHEVIRDDLIAMGRAICAADRATVAKLRAQCTKRIIFTAIDRSSPRPRQAAAPTMAELEKEFVDLVQWINHAACFADIVLEPKLRAMAEAVRARDMPALVQSKAECIVAAITLHTPSSSVSRPGV